MREPLSKGFVLFPLLTCIRLSPMVELASLSLLLLVCLIGKPAPLRRAQYIPMLLLVGVCGGISLARVGPFSEALLLAMATAAAILAGRRADAETAIRSLVAGMVIYMGANVVGWLAGIQSPAARVRVGLLENPDSILGVRVLFPFVRSINEPAIVASAFIAYVLVARCDGRRLTRRDWFGLLLAAFMIMATGSRFPVLVLVAVLAVAFIKPTLTRRIPAAAVVAVALPYVYDRITDVLVFIADQLAGIEFLSRGQTAAELAGGSSRVGFWQIGLNYWGSSAGPTPHEHLIGYGYNGHVKSGVVYSYFGSGPDFFVNDVTALTLHNSYLQQMYDTGYIGLAALVVGLWTIGQRFSRAKNWPVCAVIAVLIATSMVEVYLVPTARTIPLLLLLALSVVPLRDKSPSRERPSCL